MKLLTGSLYMAFFLFSFTTIAQDKSPVKFGKISSADFDLSKYNFDTSVSAVVISDVGSSRFQGNTKGWFSLVFKHQKRVKILNKNGFEAANIEIPLYSQGEDEEKLTDLKAYTYNLENGKVIETKLDVKGAVFKDKINKNWIRKKFTLRGFVTDKESGERLIGASIYIPSKKAGTTSNVYGFFSITSADMSVLPTSVR